MTINAQILNFIEHPDPDCLETLALALFAHQFAKVEPYRQFVLSRGRSPANVRNIAEIPPVSTAAFKYVEFCSGDPQRVFLTSGTTRGREERGRHPIADLELYRASALKHLERMLFPDGCRPWMLALHPTADRMPESSLSQMISWCIEVFGGGSALCCATPQKVDVRAALGFLRQAEHRAAPLCILATTAAIASLFEHLSVNRLGLHLAAGSRLMDTGGAKGQSHPLSSGDLLEMAGKYLAIPPAWVINEYGMTELCSQLYDATSANSAASLRSDGVERVKVAPPWLKVFARDPKNLHALAPGEIGLLSFFDLANAGSVSALLTEDLGVVNADGTVRLFGRYLSAEPRGCALGIEQFAERQPHPLPAQGEGKENRGAVGGLAVGSADISRTRGKDEKEVPTLSLTSERAGMRVHPSELEALASRLRTAACGRVAPQHIAAVISRAGEQWCDPGFDGRRATIAAASPDGHTPALLDASLDALFAGFTPGALTALARRVSTHDRLIGFIMPGNVMGAGLHELVQALIASAAVIVKASSFEPFFFVEFQRTLLSIDANVGSRMGVTVWDRSDRESTLALAAACDRIVAFGDDETIATLAAIAGPKLIGFGRRMSAAVIAREAIAPGRGHSLAAALARDISLFDQRGCLSPHHIMVEAPAAPARDLARCLAAELDAAAIAMPPGRSQPMAELAAARALRENARWRRMADGRIELWEGQNLTWTVIFDAPAAFQLSPLLRTVRVSVFETQDELAQRLRSATGALEGCAIADPANRLDKSREMLRGAGVSYFCEPGDLQSPPPSWPHGGGGFLRLMESADE
jgi:hypothetical protein